MKKTYLLILSILLSFSIKAQITITKSNIFGIGDSAILWEGFDVDQKFKPGPAGANVKWDFSKKKVSTNKNIFRYKAASGSIPYLDTMIYGGCNLVEELKASNGSGYFFFNTGADNSKWERVGFYAAETTASMWFLYRNNTNTTVKPLVLYEYPFTYEDELINTYGGMGNMVPHSVDSLRIQEGLYEMKVDGWGYLELPYKVYPNALRVKVHEYFYMYLHMLDQWMSLAETEDNTYYWFVEGVKGPVMSLIKTKSGTSAPTYSVKYNIVPKDEIEVDFAANTTTGTVVDTFTVTNLSEPLNSPSVFTWEFTPSTVHYQKGTNYASKHPIVTFDNPGKYTCKLTIYNENFTTTSVSEEKVKYFDIAPEPKLESDFSLPNNTAINTGEMVTFVNNTDPKTGTTYKWTILPSTGWAWDNFTEETSEAPSVNFSAAGCYSVRLVATNSGFNNSPVTTTKMKYISVNNGCGTAQKVTFTVTDGANPVAGAKITVNGGTLTTNASGIATTNLTDGSWPYTVTAVGFQDASASVTVSGAAVSVPVTLTAKPKYTVTFTVKNVKNEVLSGVEINIGANKITTNASGVATIDLYDETYNYTAALAGYNNYAGSFEVSGSAKAVAVTLTPIPVVEKYDVTFVVKSGANAVANATVTVTGQTPVNTDAEGKAVIKLKKGNYIFKVEAAGYDVYNNNFAVADAVKQVDVNLTSSSATKHKVTFTVTDGTNPVANAAVKIDGQTPKTTDASGKAIINLADGNYNFKVVAAGYNEYNNSFEVAGADKDVAVKLVKAVAGGHLVTFTVTDGTNSVVGAIITIEGQGSINTDNNGKAKISLADGNYNFKVVATGFDEYNSAFSVGGVAKDIPVVLKKAGSGDKYLTKFKVTDGTNAIAGATITVSGQSPINTTDDGKASIKLPNADYTYTVTADGFKDFNGTFEVEGSMQTLNITLIKLTAIDDIENNVAIFPNPTSGVFALSGVQNAEIKIVDCIGRTVYEAKSEKQTMQIDLANQKKGVYFVEISTQNKPVKLIIK